LPIEGANHQHAADQQHDDWSCQSAPAAIVVSGWANGVEAADQSQLASQSTQPALSPSKNSQRPMRPTTLMASFSSCCVCICVGASARLRGPWGLVPFLALFFCGLHVGDFSSSQSPVLGHGIILEVIILETFPVVFLAFPPLSFALQFALDAAHLLISFFPRM